MRASVRIAFALLFLSLPAGHVVAQVPPKALAPGDAPLLVDDAAAVGPEVSVPTPPERLLWQPMFEDRDTALEPAAVATPLPRAWSDWSTEKKVLVVGGGVLALMIIGIVSIG